MEKEKASLSKEEKRKETIRVVKFILFSVSAGVIEFLSFTLFSILPGYNNRYYWVAALASLILSVIWNSTLNRKFTFQSAKNVPIAMIQVLAYYVVFAPISRWLVQTYLIDTLGWNEFIVKGTVMFVNFVTEFLYQRFYVFRDSIDTNKKTKEENE